MMSKFYEEDPKTATVYVIGTIDNSEHSPLYATRNLFREYLSLYKPLSYSEWLSLDDENKAAALYVRFFNEIVLAWMKAKSFYGSEEEGVETVLQYLCKNVPIIKNEPKRYNERYIYRVAYNCMYCICHDRKIDKDRFENETSNLVVNDEDDTVIDLFDKAVMDDPIEPDMIRDDFWSIIEDLGEDTCKVAEDLINGKKINMTSAKNSKIIANLKTALNDFIDLLN